MSEIKKCFTSRFHNGKLIEVDLAQIEIVVLAWLSGDENMKKDVEDGVDFHCKRLAFSENMNYFEVKNLCNIDPVWKDKRRKIKEFSFQRSYGAGKVSIAETTGIPEEEVQKFIDAENKMYPKVVELHNKWIQEVASTAGFDGETQETPHGLTAHKGYLTAPNGRRYALWQEESKDFRSGAWKVSFKPTKVKNRMVQGFAQDIIKVLEGKIWDEIVSDKQLFDNIKPIVQVHDDIKFDVAGTFVDTALSMIRGIFDSAPELVSEAFGVEFDLPIRYNITIGDNLYDREEI